MSKQSPDQIDTEHTDELPVLLETVVLSEDIAPVSMPRHDDTAKHPVLRGARVDETGSAELVAALRERAEQIPSLEAQIRLLTDDAHDLQLRVAHKDLQLQELSATVASLRRAAADATAAAPGTAAAPDAPRELADAALPESEQLREEHAALASYIANRRAWWDELQ